MPQTPRGTPTGELFAATHSGLEELLHQAETGYEHQRQRSSTLEQRANFFLGAAGLTTTLVLANAGLFGRPGFSGGSLARAG